MLSRDEEMLAQHIREAMPGTLAVVLTGELHSLLRAERERWAAEMKAQQRDHRKAVQDARAEGFARAREQAARHYDERAASLRADAEMAGGEKLRLELGECAEQWKSEARIIRAMKDEEGT